MIWPFSLYSELARLTAREAVLMSECGSLRAEITTLREDRDGLLDRLLVATGSRPMGEPITTRPPVGERAQSAAPRAPVNMREYQRFAEMALNAPIGGQE